MVKYPRTEPSNEIISESQLESAQLYFQHQWLLKKATKSCFIRLKLIWRGDESHKEKPPALMTAWQQHGWLLIQPYNQTLLHDKNKNKNKTKPTTDDRKANKNKNWVEPSVSLFHLDAFVGGFAFITQAFDTAKERSDVGFRWMEVRCLLCVEELEQHCVKSARSCWRKVMWSLKITQWSGKEEFLQIRLRLDACRENHHSWARLYSQSTSQPPSHIPAFLQPPQTHTPPTDI